MVCHSNKIMICPSIKLMRYSIMLVLIMNIWQFFFKIPIIINSNLVNNIGKIIDTSFLMTIMSSRPLVWKDFKIFVYFLNLLFFQRIILFLIIKIISLVVVFIFLVDNFKYLLNFIYLTNQHIIISWLIPILTVVILIKSISIWIMSFSILIMSWLRVINFMKISLIIIL